MNKFNENQERIFKIKPHRRPNTMKMLEPSNEFK